MKNMVKAALTVIMIICLIAVVMPATAINYKITGVNATHSSPARIELKAERSHITADDLENIKLTAYVYDALDSPVADGNHVNFTIGNATSNTYTSGFTWSINNGSFIAPPGSGTFTNVTRGGTGSTNALFGWVPRGLGGENSTIWAYINGTNIYATVKIYFAAPTASWTGYVVDSSGIGLGGINVKLHVMGYDATNQSYYEIYNMTRTTSSSPPFVGHFAFDYIMLQGASYRYVDAQAQLTDNLTIYGKSNNLSMNRSATSIGVIVLKATTVASPSATAKPTPGFEVLFAIAGSLGVVYLITRKED